jgi:uncharacterized protein with ATP-grasp and redox domains
MNLFADESLDRVIVDRLQKGGHEVVYVAELAPINYSARISDKSAAAAAKALRIGSGMVSRGFQGNRRCTA